MKVQELRKHYKDIDHYINSQPEEISSILDKVRQTIKKAVPEAEEVISYQMPAFRFHGIIMWFASFKNHYSFFARPQYLRVFKEELTGYKTTKSAVNVPFDAPIPSKLITKIAKYAAKQNIENEIIKSKLKTQKVKYKKDTLNSVIKVLQNFQPIL